jgi:hypothetical protein
MDDPGSTDCAAMDGGFLRRWQTFAHICRMHNLFAVGVDKPTDN